MAAKSKWGARLSKMKSGWASSEQQYKEMFGASDLPEDTYVAKLQDCELSESNAGNLRVKREHVIVEGDHKGVVVRDGLNLENEYGPVFCRRWLAMLGVDVPENPEELETLLAEVKEAAPVCKIRVRHSGDFTNVDVISVLGEDGEELSGGEAEGGEEGGEEIDLDGMDKNELRALVKENDLEIDGWRKMDEDTLREAIREQIGGEEGSEEGAEGEEEGIDLDALDKDGLLALIKENEIDAKDLGFKNPLLMKKATEEKLREAITAYMAEAEGGEESGEGAGADDELLEQAKVFCGTWDVEIAEDADLDDIKAAIAECQFPEKEIDEDEKALLTALELTECIQVAKPKVSAKSKIVGKKK